MDKKYFYLKTLEELRNENIPSTIRGISYIIIMHDLAIKHKGRKILFKKLSTLPEDFWRCEFGYNWNEKWLRPPSVQLEFKFD